MSDFVVTETDAVAVCEVARSGKVGLCEYWFNADGTLTNEFIRLISGMLNKPSQ